MSPFFSAFFGPPGAGFGSSFLGAASPSLLGLSAISAFSSFFGGSGTASFFLANSRAAEAIALYSFASRLTHAAQDASASRRQRIRPFWLPRYARSEWSLPIRKA